MFTTQEIVRSLSYIVYICLLSCPEVKTQSTGCGPNHSRGRVVGGWPAAECEFPWQVAITIGSVFCGGSIVDKRHIVTAAHCMKDKNTGALLPASSVYVRVGSSSISNTKFYRVSNVYVHPRHIPSINDYDVAVLTLAQDLIFSYCVAPICLPDYWENPEDADYCTSSGWGVTDFYSYSLQQKLRAVELPIVNQNQCQQSYGSRLINNLKFCAGDYINGGIDTCQGDSGGPLMCLRQGRFVLYGIVSFGTGCARARYPGIYTRVSNSNILSFIQSALEN
ncbi:trypsin-7 [Biomphalaria pfeifferi]|uniref:Trypsin-7 n=1 Tax=Biomphalaria pfeifferi TaxID=112525 RepID=A0AAD8FED3_BIOPF|nr:trypsin-7 [Biomphalaria pfeifferi]